jgi:hypothetical protein
MKEIDFPVITLPANSSRHFTDQKVAIQQPTGQLKIEYDAKHGFFFNGLFDATLLRHDLSYCTKDDFHLQATELYFLELIKKFSDTSLIIDIGCGSGEFVDFLRNLGYDALGFDPVNNKKEEYFYSDYFHPTKTLISDKNNSSKVLFVMRCVLPHIVDPFAYLDSLFSAFPNSQVLLEYQNLEWIIAHQIWYQFSHDHMNYFSIDSFNKDFNVITKDVFSNEEWSYCLLERNQELRISETSNQEYSRFAEDIFNLFRVRENQILKYLSEKSPLAIYGAAGKGIVFGFTLQQSGVENIIAIDASPERQGKFMEVSGIPILSSKIFSEVSIDAGKVLVLNPQHYEYVLFNVPKKHKVIKISQGNC